MVREKSKANKSSPKPILRRIVRVSGAEFLAVLRDEPDSHLTLCAENSTRKTLNILLAKEMKSPITHNRK